MTLPPLPRPYNIVIIGDVMIDHYVFGQVNRKSPEADIDVLDYASESQELGGAANVALNILNLGCHPTLISVVGADKAGEDLRRICLAKGIDPSYIIEDKNRKTTTKRRFFNGENQILRVDTEDTEDLQNVLEKEIISSLSSNLYKKGIDAIILQDYNKGVLTENLITDIIAFAHRNDIKIFVDPKFNNFFAYKGCYLFKPNLRELSHAYGVEDIHLNEVPLHAAQLMKEINAQKVIITLSADGIYGLASDYEGIIPVLKGAIKDVSGAGDTVISCLCVAELLGLSTKKAIEFANFCARKVCLQLGVKPIIL